MLSHFAFNVIWNLWNAVDNIVGKWNVWLWPKKKTSYCYSIIVMRRNSENEEFSCWKLRMKSTNSINQLIVNLFPLKPFTIKWDVKVFFTAYIYAAQNWMLSFAEKFTDSSYKYLPLLICIIIFIYQLKAKLLLRQRERKQKWTHLNDLLNKFFLFPRRPSIELVCRHNGNNFFLSSSKMFWYIIFFLHFLCNNQISFLFI